jgi:hypothetical protein
MTAVGKILVFVNLVVSVLVGALVTMIYTARTHWVDEYNKLESRYRIAVASEETYKREAGRLQNDIGQKVEKAAADLKMDVPTFLDQITSRHKALMTDLGTQRAELDRLRKQLANTETVATKSEAVTKAGQEEIKQRQADFEKLKATLLAQSEANTQLVRDANKLREDKVAADIQLRSMTDRAGRLEAQLQETTKELVRLKASGGATTTRLASGKNPPPEYVDGLVQNSDPASGLVTITIGSDAGLAKGQTLEVFRLSSLPHQSKYLGTIRILEVTATKAVGQPTGRMAAPPQAGDRVASSIMGNS